MNVTTWLQQPVGKEKQAHVWPLMLAQKAEKPKEKLLLSLLLSTCLRTAVFGRQILWQQTVQTPSASFPSVQGMMSGDF